MFDKLFDACSKKSVWTSDYKHIAQGQVLGSGVEAQKKAIENCNRPGYLINSFIGCPAGYSLSILPYIKPWHEVKFTSRKGRLL